MLDAVLDGINQRFGYDSAYVPDIMSQGRFVTITSGGIKPEGQQYDGIYRTHESAKLALYRHIKIYTKGARTVYWRREVEIREIPLFEDRSWEYNLPAGSISPIILYVAICRMYAE